MPFPRIAFTFLVFYIPTAFSWTYKDPKKKPFISPTSAFWLDDTSLTGKQLAQKYCQTCHLFPEPTLLDQKTWSNSVLPNMGLRLGLKVGKDPYTDLSEEEAKSLRSLHIYPEQPLISMEVWQKIVNYYAEEAPPTPLPQSKSLTISKQLPLFTATELKLHDKPIPQTTLIKYNPTTALLYVGDAQNELYVVDSSLQLKHIWALDSPPSDIDFPKNAPPRLLTLGSFEPSNLKTGRLIALDTLISPANLDSLPRPVQFATADLNADGSEDMVICGFGNHSGKLFWYDNAQQHQKENILYPFAGARKVEIRDLNNDQKPDIVALTAQAYEGVRIFYNLGKNQFKEKIVLQFPPSFGVSYFELADFNKDGFQDILLTNGDNWDYSAIPKNYHGIRIYLNDGRDNFKEAWFYPYYGTSKAVARDFDGDGDLDIAAISFYANLDQPEQGFLYFSNQGNLKFEAFSTPEAATGKWLTMEVADYDHDGDSDIVLGSYFHNVGELTQLIFKGITSFPQLLVLTNQAKK